MESYITEIANEKKKLYRKNYYEKNKDKIQKYQKEYYRKYIKTKEKKKTTRWRGEKLQTLKITHTPVVISFQ